MMLHVYFDYAATTPLDEGVLEAMVNYERSGRGNPGRGLHDFAARAERALQESREKVANFIGVQAREIVFTKGTTEGCNIIARGFRSHKKNIVLTAFDHHATLLPWKRRAEEAQWEVRIVPARRDWTLDLEAAEHMIDQETAMVIAPHVSNVTGTILPLRELGRLAHAADSFMFVDAAQSVGHMTVAVHELECDGLAFSGHKMYGPMGIGALWMNERLQHQVDPLLFGGGMFGDGPLVRFEAGTINVTGAIGLAVACGENERERCARIMREKQWLEMLCIQLMQRTRVRLFSPPQFCHAGIISFGVEGVHAHDVAQSLADRGIAVRAGYHCAEPLARLCRQDGTVRVSIGKFTTEADIHQFLHALDETISLWTR